MVTLHMYAELGISAAACLPLFYCLALSVLLELWFEWKNYSTTKKRNEL